jgi:hypothetical protein
MFGMLDYRAHKLLWLLLWPVSLANLLVGYVAVLAAAVYVGARFGSYYVLLQIGIAWLIGQVALAVLSLLFWLVTSLIKRAFFWTIDVVPAHGANKEEAKQVVLRGPIYSLSKKLDADIHEWTDDDTNSLIRTFNWRARWFFPVQERTRAFVRELRRQALEEGKQPCELDAKAVEAIRRQTGEPDWFEIAITNAYIFHGALVLIVTVGVIWYMGSLK